MRVAVACDAFHADLAEKYRVFRHTSARGVDLQDGTGHRSSLTSVVYDARGRFKLVIVGHGGHLVGTGSHNLEELNVVANMRLL